MTAHRILIAGIGNIFLGDDAFGVEVARRLLEARIAGGGSGRRFRHQGARPRLRPARRLRGRGDGRRGAARRPAGTLYLIEPDTSQPVDAGDASVVEAIA